MNILKLYQDYNIPTAPENHKHSRPGWVNTQCPYCAGSPGYHLGFNEKFQYFFCWRCGWHKTFETIEKLCHVTHAEARGIFRKYKGTTTLNRSRKRSHIPRIKGFKFPSHIGPLQKYHRQYLRKRNFDPEYLESVWDVQGTGPISLLDGADYKLRIIAPILWNGKVVSFQGRSIGNAKLKYKACPKARELVNHQTIIYGLEDKWNSDVGVCVEGIFDAWRLGPKSFSVFGISYTPHQVIEIARRFKKVIVVFDNEVRAQRQARKLVKDLRSCGVHAARETVPDDPANLSPDDAKHLIHTLLH